MIGNLAIAVIKFLMAAITGSSAMISEGIHSLVDTGSGVLLSHGMSQARVPADDEHPFGRGKSLYFWTLVVAVSIFGVGGGMSLYEGVSHICLRRAEERPDHGSHGVANHAYDHGVSRSTDHRDFGV